jgi:hypothetical protein
MRLKHLRSVAFAVASSAAVYAWVVTPSNRGAEAYRNEIEHPEAMPPPDADEKTEFAFARLRYPSFRTRFAFYSWGTDSPKSERQFILGLRRLTRLHARSIEEIVNLDDERVYDWPWMYAVEVGHWDLSTAQADRLRDYLLRGGFLMTDDFHGTVEWDVFMASMRRVFPDRPVVDIKNEDQIFHVLYDLSERFQVPGLQFLYSGRVYEYDGYTPYWRGIYDDSGRLMVLIIHNQDLGDAWEWADHPAYPERYASQAYRLGINCIMYAMTH